MLNATQINAVNNLIQNLEDWENLDNDELNQLSYEITWTLSGIYHTSPTAYTEGVWEEIQECIMMGDTFDAFGVLNMMKQLVG